LYRNPRFYVPLFFGLLVALLFLFATVAVATTVTIVGAVVIGFGFALVALRSRV